MLQHILLYVDIRTIFLVDLNHNSKLLQASVTYIVAL
jgi:hypothetical protein